MYLYPSLSGEEQTGQQAHTDGYLKSAEAGRGWKRSALRCNLRQDLHFRANERAQHVGLSENGLCGITYDRALGGALHQFRSTI